MVDHLVAHAGIAGPHAERALEVGHGLVELRVLLQEHAEIEVRVEVERVASELGFELGLGTIAIAGFEQGAAVQRVHAGQLGVQRDRLGQFLEAAGEVLRAALGHPEHQVRLGRVAAFQDPVDEHAALLHLLFLEIGQAEHVGEREIVLAGGSIGASSSMTVFGAPMRRWQSASR